MGFRLADARPNPFNPATTIEYTLPVRAHVTLEVFNVVGRRVAVLADGVMTAGAHRAVWDARGMPSGIYVYRLKTRDGLVGTKKALLVK
jgi:hypothetical protein